jgi:hypothetical protein
MHAPHNLLSLVHHIQYFVACTSLDWSIIRWSLNYIYNYQQTTRRRRACSRFLKKTDNPIWGNKSHLAGWKQIGFHSTKKTKTTDNNSLSGELVYRFSITTKCVSIILWLGSTKRNNNNNKDNIANLCDVPTKKCAFWNSKSTPRTPLFFAVTLENKHSRNKTCHHHQHSHHYCGAWDGVPGVVDRVERLRNASQWNWNWCQL